MRILTITLILASVLTVVLSGTNQEKNQKGQETPKKPKETPGKPLSPEQIAKYEKKLPGLKKDKELFGKCKGKELKTSELRVKAALACKNETEYTCYWPCLMRERGFSGPDGLKKYKEYYKGRYTMDQKETFVNTLAVCLQEAALETKECNYNLKIKNSFALNCMLSVYDNYCSTGRTTYKLSDKLNIKSDDDAAGEKS